MFRRSHRSHRSKPISETVDLSTTVGAVTLAAPVMTAAGTSGHGAELSAYFDLSRLGAVVVKSLSAEPWAGNAPPRVRPLADAMINSVGLQNPGIEAFLAEDLSALQMTGAKVVVSIWGRRVEDYARAAALLSHLPDFVVAVEVNVSCPNLEDRSKMFAHSPTATAEVIAAAKACNKPLWAKLSPNVAELVDVADAALFAGAESITLVNTLLAMQIDLDSRRPNLGAGGGGMSGARLHPFAVRAVYDCRAAFPDASIVGVGGVRRGEDAIELLLAGANAIEVGTATLVEPTATLRIVNEIAAWCERRGVQSIAELIGAAHG